MSPPSAEKKVGHYQFRRRQKRRAHTISISMVCNCSIIVCFWAVGAGQGASCVNFKKQPTRGPLAQKGKSLPV